MTLYKSSQFSAVGSHPVTRGTPPPPNTKMKFLIPIIALSLNCCTGVLSGLTGQPTHATAVKRNAPDAKPVQIATSDLLQAEAGPPEKVHGLYDVGLVAGGVAQVVKSGK